MFRKKDCWGFDMRDMIQRPESMAAPHLAEAGGPLGTARGVDLRKYFYMIAKRLWLLLFCFMTSVVIMLVVLFYRQGIMGDRELNFDRILRKRQKFIEKTQRGGK